VIRDPSGGAPIGVAGPGRGQVQFAVDQRVTGW
jgi:hypothetical protein